MMRKILLMVVAIMISGLTYAQLSGNKFIPGDYASIALAVTDLNTQGVGAGGVTFSIAAGHTETTTDAIIITASGTQANPIVFKKRSGVPVKAANPLITRTDPGTIATSTLGGQGDAVIIIEGSDYVTFDSIDVAANDPGIEYGYYLRKAGVTNGCKFVTIHGSTITMNKGTSQYVVGIYSSNNDPTSTVSSALGITVTSIEGRNESVTLTGNTIQNVFSGIVLRGFNHTTAPREFFDHFFHVGLSGNGNVIQNFAGNVSSTAYGIYVIYHDSIVVSHNYLNNTDGGGTGFTSTAYGIMSSTAASSSVDILNNLLTLTSNATTSILYGIYNSSGSTAAGNTINIGNNTVTNCSYITATSGSFTAMYNLSSAETVNIFGNTVSNNTTSGTGSFTGIDGGSPGDLFMYENTVSGNTKTGASGSMFCTRAGTAVVNYFDNTVFNNSFTDASGTTTCNIYGYYNIGSPTAENIFDNIIYNLTVSGTNTATGSTMSGIHTSSASGTVKHIRDNHVYGLNALSGTVSGIM